MNPKIEYLESSERFGMSGPWIGKLKVNGEFLKFEFLDENFVTNNSQNLIAFNRFEDYQYEKNIFSLFKPKINKRIFRILVLDVQTQKWYLSNNSFEALLLLEFNRREIYFRETFFDLERFEKKLLSFDEENFLEVEKGEV